MLDEQLYQDWLLQLQTWAADGLLFAAGVDALRLKPGNATDQLRRIGKAHGRVLGRKPGHGHRALGHFAQGFGPRVRGRNTGLPPPDQP